MEGPSGRRREHASWLNMVEIEIGVLKRQCLDRRIDDREKLEREIAAWERQRNLAGAHLKWMFTTEKARTKMGRAYPRPAAALDQPAKESQPLCRRTSDFALPCLVQASGSRVPTRNSS